jgi:serine/threonine-protein kinase RIO1
MFGMTQVDSESPREVERWLRRESADLWPAADASARTARPVYLVSSIKVMSCTVRRKLSEPSIGRANGRRVSVYVAEELVPEVQRTLNNGRALQDLLHQAAPRYIKALKRARAAATKSDKG